jgi:probable HAF family extracellular repeat protein
MKFNKLVLSLGLLFAASTCFAQMYTVTDIGALTSPRGISVSGEVVGDFNEHAFIWTSANGFQDLGTLLGGTFSHAAGINDQGTVVGTADGEGIVISTFPDILPDEECNDLIQPFLWTPTGGMRGLGTKTYPLDKVFYNPGGGWCSAIYASGINRFGQGIGYTPEFADLYQFGLFWNEAGVMSYFGSTWPPTFPNDINSAGEIVGQNSDYAAFGTGHATTWKGGVAIDLGTLGGDALYYGSSANGVNDLGIVVGWSTNSPTRDSSFRMISSPVHAVLWTPNGAMQDLGALPGDTSSAGLRINFFGEVIGTSGDTLYSFDYSRRSPFQVVGRPFIWSENSVMQDLNRLIQANSGWVLGSAKGINSFGQIVGEGTLNGEAHGFLLDPIYKTSVQQPINADGSSIFGAKRGVIPVKFTLTQYDVPTCGLLPATIAITRTAGGTLGAIDESTYVANADSGSDFRINGCQYIYNLAASSLGVGTYRVDISINGIMVGHAVFALK